MEDIEKICLTENQSLDVDVFVAPFQERINIEKMDLKAVRLDLHQRVKCGSHCDEKPASSD